MLSEKEKEMYQRQLGINSWGLEVQQKLKESHVFIAGAGGLGSPVLFYLGAAGIGNITICDSDIVDLTNLNRQILHNHQSIGIDKVESAYQKIKDLNPYIKISPLKKKITKSNAESLISGHDIIIDCLDNFKTRFILNEVAIKTGIPVVHGGVAGFNGQISFLHPPQTVCLGCIISPKDSKEKIYIAGATAGVMGSLQATEAIKFIGGIGDNLKNRILFYDGIDMRFEIMNIRKNPKCKYCGNKSK